MTLIAICIYIQVKLINFISLQKKNYQKKNNETRSTSLKGHKEERRNLFYFSFFFRSIFIGKTPTSETWRRRDSVVLETKPSWRLAQSTLNP